ncbi:MAG: flagellar FlbD family protein [Bacillota bacterium]|nr:flagellar FlbD family protein [Bacillota bacterium]
MIKVTKLNGDSIYVNSDLIEFVESVPDTMITLTTGKKIIIKETADFVVERVIDYRRKLVE